MALLDTGVFLFRCTRCCAAFVLRRRDEKHGAISMAHWMHCKICEVCRKGSVEYVGIVWVKGDSVESPG